VWGFAWEPIVSAAIAGILALVGVILTVRSQSDKTRKAGLAQHQDQDKKLDELLKGHRALDKKIDQNKEIAETGLAELSGQVKGVMSTTETLFGMIVDLDKKATSRGNKVTKTLRVMEDAVNE
jgi:hypothetical protein